MKSYRRKITKDKDSSDSDRAYPRKAFNSSERQRAKIEVKEDIAEFPQFNWQQMREIRWQLDEDSHRKCQGIQSMKMNMLMVFWKLEVISKDDWYDSDTYVCNCPDFDSMSDEEVLKRAGYLSTKF